MARLGGGPSVAPARAPVAPEASKKGGANVPRGTLGVYQDPDSAVQAARRGFEANERLPVATRAKMIEAMRAVALAKNSELSRYAVEESGLGRYEDKLVKNKLVADKTPG